MKCLVTGGAGFLGSSLVHALIQKGYDVRILARSKETLKNLQDLPVEIKYGDVRNKQEVLDAMTGVDYVFHVASLYADTPFYVRYPRLMYETNILGAKNICESALEKGVKKVIYTGTTGSIGCVSGETTNESAKFNCSNLRSHYEKSKAEAEEIVLSFHKKGLNVVAVNPSFLIGIQDSRPTPTGEMIVSFLNRRYPCYFDAQLSLSDMASTVEAHISALLRGKSGERYIVCSDKIITIKDFFQILENISGIPAPKIRVPLTLLYWFSVFNELLIAPFKMLGFSNLHPIIYSEVVHYFMIGCAYDPTKAKQELGFAPRPIENAAKESVDWYMKNGYVKKSSYEIYCRKNNSGN